MHRFCLTNAFHHKAVLLEADSPASPVQPLASFSLDWNTHKVASPLCFEIISHLNFDIPAEQAEHLRIVQDVELEGTIASHFCFSHLLGFHGEDQSFLVDLGELCLGESFAKISWVEDGFGKEFYFFDFGQQDGFDFFGHDQSTMDNC